MKKEREKRNEEMTGGFLVLLAAFVVGHAITQNIKVFTSRTCTADSFAYSIDMMVSEVSDECFFLPLGMSLTDPSSAT